MNFKNNYLCDFKINSPKAHFSDLDSHAGGFLNDLSLGDWQVHNVSSCNHYEFGLFFISNSHLSLLENNNLNNLIKNEILKKVLTSEQPSSMAKAVFNIESNINKINDLYFDDYIKNFNLDFNVDYLSDLLGLESTQPEHKLFTLYMVDCVKKLNFSVEIINDSNHVVAIFFKFCFD